MKVLTKKGMRKRKFIQISTFNKQISSECVALFQQEHQPLFWSHAHEIAGVFMHVESLFINAIVVADKLIVNFPQFQHSFIRMIAFVGQRVEYAIFKGILLTLWETNHFSLNSINTRPPSFCLWRNGFLHLKTYRIFLFPIFVTIFFLFLHLLGV